MPWKEIWRQGPVDSVAVLGKTWFALLVDGGLYGDDSSPTMLQDLRAELLGFAHQPGDVVVFQRRSPPKIHQPIEGD